MDPRLGNRSSKPRAGKAPEGARGERRIVRGKPCTKTHELKIWPGPFEAVVDGDKTFEFRIDDRGYEVGDRLDLREYDPAWATIDGVKKGNYTGRSIRAVVTYILRGPDHGMPEGYCVMSIRVRLRTAKLALREEFVDDGKNS